MTARDKDREVLRWLQHRGIDATLDDARTLRRAKMTLHRWYELECGDGDNYKSWAIERDEQTGVPYMAIYPNTGNRRQYRIADRENGAIRRCKAICDRLGAFMYVQTDPRGAPLYVSLEPLDCTNYSRGLCI